MNISECSMRVDNEFIIFWDIKGEQIMLPKMLFPTFREYIKAIKEGKEPENMPFMANESVLNFVKENPDIILKSIEDALNTEAPNNSLSMPMSINIQMDADGKFIGKDVLMDFLKQAVDNYIPNVVFRGDNILKNKDINEAIKYCANNNTYSFVEIRDTEFDKTAVEELIKSGVYLIKFPIDLAASSAKVLNFAQNMIKCLKENKFNNYVLTWTAKNSNIQDIKKVYALANQYKIPGIEIYGFLPQNEDDLDEIPSKENFEELYRIIRPYKHQGEVIVSINKCYSPMKAYAGKSFLLTNTNKGISRGCGAGRDEVTLNVDGQLQPCCCLNLPEDTTDIKQYWYTSKKLFQLRHLEDTTKMPCNKCEYNKFCIPCVAINHNLEDRIYKGGYNSCSICIDE